MLNLIKQKISSFYDSFTTKLSSLFSRNKLDQTFIDELKKVLITSDVGISMSNNIITQLQQAMHTGEVTGMDDARAFLERILRNSITDAPSSSARKVVLLVGINGCGKTTFAARYAYHLQNEGRQVMLVAADTFRAAGATQLEHWAEKLNLPIQSAQQGSDPASVIFDACRSFKDGAFDTLVIDTAGRLQTKTNLIKELEKIRRVIGKILPDLTVETWLTIDAMLGQNSFAQAEVFDAATHLSGLVLTKMDSTAKGGIIFSITKRFGVPIRYITHGEDVNDIAPFKADEFIRQMFEVT